MKNSNFFKNSILALLPISLGLSVLFGIPSLKADRVEAYTGASLPTTINLNDPTNSTIRSYYSGLNSLSESERKGENLLKNLKTIPTTLILGVGGGVLTVIIIIIIVVAAKKKHKKSARAE